MKIVTDCAADLPLAEIEALVPRGSQHDPEYKVPEQHWLYRFAKRHWFFGFGAYG